MNASPLTPSSRRLFLQAAAGLAAASQLQAATRIPVKKAVLESMLPKDMSFMDKFRMAREIGFEQVECHTEKDPKRADEIKKAADATGLKIHSVMNSDHWKDPLSSKDPEVRKRSRECMKVSLDNAKLWGAETVLLVPAVVNAETPYQYAWEQSTKEIKEMIPWAAERKVVIAVEEVWNKFLYSPREFAAYVDQFNSPWVKAYFDVGNCVIFGYPQDWIRTLGKRIVKLHFKDFKYAQDPTIRKRVPDFVNLREGEINWKEVHAALADIGYNGSATVELSGGDRTYLQEVSRRVDLILNGE